MWISQLDLLAFGRFTDVRLNLGPGFHLVYGPNEAGKSTTLRAIRQLLYGFDERTDDNFLHANPQLRIGGVVCSPPDLELKVIRRKTRKDSLRGEDDHTIMDSERWNQLLAGIEEKTFCQRYGIDYEQLTEGGHQIATGSGDLGEILFATGSGVTDLNAVKSRLIDEAEEIFKPLGKKQRLNMAITRWQELKDQVRDQLLSVTQWDEADRLRQETFERLKQVAERFTNLIADRDRYRRWQQAWPLVQESDRLKQALAPLQTVPRLPSDFRVKRQEALLLLEQARISEKQSLVAKQLAEEAMVKLGQPLGLLAQADQLSLLITAWGSCQKGIEDRVGLMLQRSRHTQAIDDLRQSLGHNPSDSTDTTETARNETATQSVAIDRAYRTRLGILGRQQTGFLKSHEQAQFHRDQFAHQHAECQLRLAQIPPGKPLDEFRDRLRTVQNDGDLESRLAEVQRELSTLRDDLRRQVDALGLQTLTIEAVLKLQVPAATVLKRIEIDFQTNQAEQSLLKSRLVDFEALHRQLEQKIQHLRQQFQVPTEADLDHARTQRDEIWSEILATWKSKSSPTEKQIDAFETAQRDSDIISDRLRHEADRVAQLAEELADLETNETQQHEASLRLAELEAARIELEKQWQAQWPELKGNRPSPGEIQAWLSRHEAFLKNEELVSRREREVVTITNRIAQNLATVSQLLGNAKVDDPAQENAADGVGLSLKEQIQQATDQLIRTDAVEQTRKELLESLAKLDREIIESTERLARSRTELQQWTTSWQAAMTELGLPDDATPEAAATFVENLNELADHQRQGEQLLERIRGIDADGQRFETRFKSFCVEVAPDLANDDVADGMVALRDRLIASQRIESARNEHLLKKNQAEQQLEQARELGRRGEQLVVELCDAAGVTDGEFPSQIAEFGARLNQAGRSQAAAAAAAPITLIAESAAKREALFEQLNGIEYQSQSRDQFEAMLEQINARLSELAADEPRDLFDQQVRLHSLDVLVTLIQQRETEIQQLAVERDLLNIQLGEFNLKLSQMSGSSTAADAEEQRQLCLAQIRSDAEEYLRLKLASTVLHTSIERYREKIRGPVLSIASNLFKELTLGSFESLRVDEDDNHKPILVGVRSGSRTAVSVNGMSEGTCDQLYLALRLASLQLEKAPGCNIPLIIDDILIQFDDERAIAALKLLAKMAHQRQVIFFTHHEHLLDLASEHLPGEHRHHRLEILTNSAE
jgi:uncharacterized protein YhaN